MLRFATSLMLLPMLALGARADTPAPATKAPAFAVKVVGKGKPMILIPGLACSGEVWDSTVKHFSPKYECHILTLAGFAGQTPKGGPFLDTMQKAIADYIRGRKLDRPVIVGHSIGGFLTYLLGIESPELVGPLVSVDGVPFLVALFDENADAEAAKKMGEQTLEKMSSSSREEYLKRQRGTLTNWITDPGRLETAVKWGAASDQTTVARAMSDLMSRDLRADVAKIKSPVLLLAAPVAFGNVTKEVATKRYMDQMVKFPKIKVAVAEKSKHFIMYDEPEWMMKEIESFLADAAR